MGLLAAAAEDGSFALSGAQRAELVGVVDETAVVERDLEANLLELSSALSKAGVTHRVLRGCAAAYLDYPASVQRTFRRVELLVPVPAFDDAAALFSAMGCVRRFAEPRPGFDRRFSMGTSFFTPEGHELVLRRTFVSGPYGMLVTPADLFSHSTPLQVGGRRAAGAWDRGALLARVLLRPPGPRAVPAGPVARRGPDGAHPCARHRQHRDVEHGMEGRVRSGRSRRPRLVDR